MVSLLKESGVAVSSHFKQHPMRDMLGTRDQAVCADYTNNTETGRGPQGSSIAPAGGSASNDSVSKQGIQLQNYDDLNSKKMTLNAIHSHRSDPS